MDKACTKERTKKSKYPTRLQKHAPSSLRLDGPNIVESAQAQCAIPLLSPLILSPVAAEGQFKLNENVEIGCHVVVGANGWQHPATGAMIDPSKLGAMFQSECMLFEVHCDKLVLCFKP